ncbi:MAG: hypothetical protein ABI307_05055 [Mycobacterium sp.]
MRKPVLFVMSAAAMALTICAAVLSPIDTGTATAAPSDTTGAGTRTPFGGARRACDFSKLGSTSWGSPGTGYGEAFVHTSGNTVIAEVQFTNSRFPGVHYDISMIQVPRASAPGCGPGTPGTTYAGMVMDGAGNATLTLQDQIRPGMTGVWLQIQRPSPRSQLPVEWYSTMQIVPI